MSEALAPIEDAEVVEHLPAIRPSTLLGTDDPDAFVAGATRAAHALAQVVEAQQLYKQIGKSKHVFVQGWTLLGSMLGVFPVCVWTRKLEDGWEARVEARTRSGEIVGAAEAECLRSESKWKNADDYAIRSMAQTRATSKALRQPLDFVMTLAGFNATPAEEMPSEKPKRKQLSRQEGQAELENKQASLAKIIPDWALETVLSQQSAELGKTITTWDELPDDSIWKLLRDARAASRNFEDALGVAPEESEFKAPEGPRGGAK